MVKNSTIAVLDIGSSKVACFIGHLDASGSPHVTGIGHQVSQGVRAGIILDVKQAEASILAAVNAAEKMAGEAIDRVYVSISGTSIKSHTINVETEISGQEVTDRDINHIIREGYDYFSSEEVEVLHCLPFHYSIDDSRGIRDPRGMYGETLSTTLQVITVSSTVFRNIANCLARCRLHIEGCVVSSYAAGLACLTEDEKNLGALLIDIGGGNTSVGVFADGCMIYADSVPLGGIHVTKDIASGLSTTISYAERIKTLYGSAISAGMDKRETIDIPLNDMQGDGSEGEQGAENTAVSRAVLTSIIKPRMEEICEMVQKKLEASGFHRVPTPRLILTGGGSQLEGVKELAGHMFSRHARVAKPVALDGLAEATKGSAFSVPVGMMLYAARKRTTVHGSIEETEAISKNYFKRFVEWVQGAA